MSDHYRERLRRLGAKRTKARARLAAADAELLDAVLDADGKVPRKEIAQLAGVNRWTVYLWIDKNA